MTTTVGTDCLIEEHPMKGCTTSTPLVHQRFRRGSAERAAVGRLQRSFRGTGDGSLWQPDDERAARTRALGKHQPTLVALDDLPGDRQPETRTPPELAGAPVEALEDPVPILVGDPGTLVADCHP